MSYNRDPLENHRLIRKGNPMMFRSPFNVHWKCSNKQISPRSFPLWPHQRQTLQTTLSGLVFQQGPLWPTSPVLSASVLHRRQEKKNCNLTCNVMLLLSHSGYFFAAFMITYHDSGKEALNENTEIEEWWVGFQHLLGKYFSLRGQLVAKEGVRNDELSHFWKQNIWCSIFIGNNNQYKLMVTLKLKRNYAILSVKCK